MAGGSGTAGTGERCPVCPFGGLDGTETTCPSCGTDLSVLRRVQGLPVAILEDAVGLARAGDVEGARTALHAAAAFTRTREQALALLRGIGSGCPNPACRLRGRRGGGNVVLFRRYGPSATPLWRCRVCGRTFSGNRSSVTFRSRLSREEVYGIVAELLEGRTVGEIAASDGGPSEERVRRLALRALEIGPSVVQEVAEGTGRAVADLRAGWRRFARTAGGWAGRS